MIAPTPLLQAPSPHFYNPYSMRAERIAELLEPFFDREAHDLLTAEDLEHLSTYVDVLLRWNSKINLTAILDPEEIVTRHFGESFFLARHLFPDARRHPLRGVRPKQQDGSVVSRSPARLAKFHLADLGSGAGFPGIPIKIWDPGALVTLIESNQKKATFLREIVRNLALQDINVESVRAETLANETFDAVTFRAVEQFKEVLAVAMRLVRPSGRIALLISSSQVPEVLSRSADFEWRAALPVPLSRQRVVLIGKRESEL